MLELPRPRFVEVRRPADGSVAFYFRIPTYYRKRGCEIANQPLGTGYETACGEDGRGGRAAALNAIFDEWNDQRRGELFEQAKIARYGSIDWPFRQYKTEKAYTEKVSPRSRPDYERVMQTICDTVGRSGRRIGERQIREVTPRAADKIYGKIINGQRRPAQPTRGPRWRRRIEYQTPYFPGLLLHQDRAAMAQRKTVPGRNPRGQGRGRRAHACAG